ncbi:MAG TPA: hypothetical protein VK811_02770 [Candidatus Acidoferrum sp.]|jgi:hypothetical protein|nr:hypothetical protein [Candidatus Acidoferrum sp.]
MNNQEAKLILQAYRPNGQDASVPFFAEALEQSRRDPELQKWFAEEMVLNSRLQTRLEGAIPIPPGLKADLLALKKTVRPVPWWSQPLKLAAAAVILISLGAIFHLLSRNPMEVTSFRDTMALSSAQTEEHVVFESHDIAKIQQWLQARNMETNFDLPSTLQAGTPQGCRVVDWNGHQATMICFMINGEHMDLYVMDRSGLPDFPDFRAPQFASANGLMTAMWANGGKVYLLTGRDKEVLQKVFQQT